MRGVRLACITFRKDADLKLAGACIGSVDSVPRFAANFDKFRMVFLEVDSYGLRLRIIRPSRVRCLLLLLL